MANIRQRLVDVFIAGSALLSPIAMAVALRHGVRTAGHSGLAVVLSLLLLAMSILVCVAAAAVGKRNAAKIGLVISVAWVIILVLVVLASKIERS